MTTPLSPRTIHAYRRLAKPLAALVKVTRDRTSGAVGAATIASCNRVIVAANTVFSRDPDIGHVPLLPAGEPLTAIDLAVTANELLVAAMRFEERHPEIDPPSDAELPAH